MRVARCVGFAAMGLLLFALAPPVEAAAPESRTGAADRARPNIILILTDDWRWDALGCMGNRQVRTPNLDRLAERGTLFRNMFCTTSICATSRASFLTGQYASRHGVHDFRTPLTEAAFGQTFPSLLRRQGYRTAFVGKWGMGAPLPEAEYDYFDGFPGQGRYYQKGRAKHMTEFLRDRTLAYLETCVPGQPFCMQLSTKAVHCQDGDSWPFQTDSRYNALFDGVTMPLAKTANEQAFAKLPVFLRESEARKRWEIRFSTPAKYQKSVKDYYRLIKGVDDLVGDLVDLLRERGLADDTVIIFTADNGFFLGEHGLAGKWFMHEESIRLPLLIHDPRLSKDRQGGSVESMALSIDIAPTILELAGITAPAVMQGRSLVPLIEGSDVPWRDAWFYEHRFRHPRIPMSEGIRTERWKYVRYYGLDPVSEELYDIRDDPMDEHNLLGDPDHRDTLYRLRTRWKALRAAAR